MLEQLVRPFQRRDLAPRTRIVVSVGTGTEPIIVEFGTAGSLPSGKQDSLEIKLEKEKESYKETNRKTRKVRIENPDDKDQYVMVERPEKMKFDKKKTPADKDAEKARPKEQSISYSNWPGDPRLREFTDLTPEEKARSNNYSKVEINFKQGEPPEYPTGF